MEPCSVCRYPLADSQPTCPECGSDPEARRAASRRRRVPSGLIIIYIILTLPSWAALVLLAAGWTIARVVLRVPTVHVETGAYPVLDALATSAGYMVVASLVSLLALPLVPAVLMVQRWRSRLALAALIIPVLLGIGMLRPFGGAPWGLVNWLPD